jgi:hypothetical protein
MPDEPENPDKPFVRPEDADPFDTTLPGMHLPRLISLEEHKRRLAARAEETEADARTGPTSNGHDAEPAPVEEPLEPLVTFSPYVWIGKKAPERQWLVKDWVTIGSATGLYGDGGVGKTLLLQQLQTSCASALPWMGMNAEPCESIGFYCEDPDEELHRRQEWINAGYGIEMGQATGATYVPRVGMANTLMTFSSKGIGELTPLYRQWREHALDMGVRLVVVDAAADVFAGNEIDRGQVRQFVQISMGRLAMEIRGAVVLAAHPSQSGLTSGGGTSGSTGWNNAFRSRMYLDYPKSAKPADGTDSEPPDTFARVLRRMKGNYAPPTGFIEVHWRNGLLVPDSATSGPRRPAAEVYLTLLATLDGEGKRVSPNWQAQTYAPTAFSKRPRAERDGYNKGDFDRAQSDLFKQRKLEIKRVGPPSKQVEIIAATAESPPENQEEN